MLIFKIYFAKFFLKFFIEVQLAYNIMWVSGEQTATFFWMRQFNSYISLNFVRIFNCSIQKRAGRS